MRTSKATWRKPTIWNREAALSGSRNRVFTCSMSDYFHAQADPWRREAWEVIRECASLDWLTSKPAGLRVL